MIWVHSRRSAWLGVIRGALEAGGIYVYGGLLRPWMHRVFSRRYRTVDPWDYARRPYEHRKYDLKLEILDRSRADGAVPYRRALELGCSEGLFTQRLAVEGWAAEVVGVDFVGTAIERAQERCEGLLGVTFRQADVTKSLPPGPFDLVYCSEILYYLGPLRRLTVLADRIARRMAAGGRLVLVSPWPAARLLHRPFDRHVEFEQLREHVERDAHRAYVIALYSRRGGDDEAACGRDTKTPGPPS